MSHETCGSMTKDVPSYRIMKNHDFICEHNNHDFHDPAQQLKFILRVRSWLRINAGGVLNTCKSNGVFLPRPRKLASEESFGILSGGRVSNAWVTCPIQGDNSWKRLLIPHKRTVSHGTV